MRTLDHEHPYQTVLSESIIDNDFEEGFISYTSTVFRDTMSTSFREDSEPFDPRSKLLSSSTKED